MALYKILADDRRGELFFPHVVRPMHVDHVDTGKGPIGKTLWMGLVLQTEPFRSILNLIICLRLIPKTPTIGQSTSVTLRFRSHGG